MQILRFPGVCGQLLLAAAIFCGVPAHAYAPKAAKSDEAMEKVGLLAAVPEGYQTRTIEGWTVHFSDALLKQQKDAVEAALPLLQKQLAEIVREVPPLSLSRLRAVPLWFSPEYPGVPPRAEYHPGAGWLRENHRNPAMAKGVEFTNARDFEKEMSRMPNFALHELAHAYHDQIVSGGFGNAEIKAAYEKAKASKIYDQVERRNGSGRPNTFDRAYAMTNPQEYFAENTEAFFSRNDFFPFNRAELEKHDPEMCALLQKLWNLPMPDSNTP